VVRNTGEIRDVIYLLQIDPIVVLIEHSSFTCQDRGDG
jgi:hypothetical protein